jgi:hypothetical protein
MGIGSLIPLNKKLDFNPEFISQITCTVLWDQIYSLHLNLDYKLSDKFSIAAGPSIAWNYLSGGTEFYQPVFTLYQKELDVKNKLFVGLKAGLIYQFGK